ncbi:hypothetical protein PILCRDRAFT_607563 [Piloderma croceum F 1598]|uniref:Uncharacterized protein n=1 Tax=Piloderma croceum (strain F 1598) TaxID=765440 RepID=A0A0C3EZL7_PILCF|nr:hypothetical protein PILCRDRAFT_607563 [Piloderma croceum F 1598]
MIAVLSSCASSLWADSSSTTGPARSASRTSRNILVHSSRRRSCSPTAHHTGRRTTSPHRSHTRSASHTRPASHAHTHTHASTSTHAHACTHTSPHRHTPPHRHATPHATGPSVSTPHHGRIHPPHSPTHHCVVHSSTRHLEHSCIERRECLGIERRAAGGSCRSCTVCSTLLLLLLIPISVAGTTEVLTALFI